MTIKASNLEEIRLKISQIASACHRGSSEITLLAVSKTQSFAKIQSLYDLGQRHFGENYLQDALPKIQESLSNNLDIEWHFIGQLQSNKLKTIAEHFSWVQSVASLKHASRLNRYRSELKEDPINICVQAQFEDRVDRGGIPIKELNTFLTELKDLDFLKVRGLMCVLPLNWEHNKIAEGYQSLNRHFLELKEAYSLDTLSIGMSNDYALAIQNGSTMVRLGTALFGARH